MPECIFLCCATLFFKHDEYVNMKALWAQHCIFMNYYSMLSYLCCFIRFVLSSQKFAASLSFPSSLSNSWMQDKIQFCFAIWVSHLSQSSLKNHKLSILETISNKAASKSLMKTTSQCGWSALSLPRRTCDACPCLSSSGKFAPRPKSNAQSSDAEGLGNDGNDGNEGPGDDDDDGGDDG